MQFCQVSYAANTTGLQECSAIKNAQKKLECFEKQSKLIAQEENERKIKEELQKAEAEKAKIQAEAEKLEAEKERVKKAEKEKIVATAKDAIRSLKKLQNRVRTGISLQDYPSVISEAGFEVNNFNDLTDSSKIPQFGLHCTNAMQNYKDVIPVWRLKIRDASRYDNDTIYSDWNLIDSIRSKYPSTNASNSGRSMKASYIMQIIWSEASENIQKAESALKKFESEN